MIIETRIWEPTLVFNVVDGFARQWGLVERMPPIANDPHPPRGLAGLNPRPLGDIAFYAVAKMVGGQREDFARPLRLIAGQTPNGCWVFHGKVQRGKGVVLRDLLQHGIYVIQVVSANYLLYEQLNVAIPSPLQAIPIELTASTAYPFPPDAKLLRGTIRDTNGSGVSGVRVTADVGKANFMRHLQYITGNSGEWVLALPVPALDNNNNASQDQTITVLFSYPGGMQKQVTIANISYSSVMTVNVPVP